MGWRTPDSPSSPAEFASRVYGLWPAARNRGLRRNRNHGRSSSDDCARRTDARVLAQGVRVLEDAVDRDRWRRRRPRSVRLLRANLPPCPEDTREVVRTVGTAFASACDFLAVGLGGAAYLSARDLNANVSGAEQILHGPGASLVGRATPRGVEELWGPSRAMGRPAIPSSGGRVHREARWGP